MLFLLEWKKRSRRRNSSSCDERRDLDITINDWISSLPSVVYQRNRSCRQHDQFHWLEKLRELTGNELIRSFISKRRSSPLLSLSRSVDRSAASLSTPRRLILGDERKKKFDREEIPYLFQFLSIYLVGRALDVLDFSSKNLISLNRRIMRTSMSSFLSSSSSLLLLFSYALHTYGTMNQVVRFLSSPMPPVSEEKSELKFLTLTPEGIIRKTSLSLSLSLAFANCVDGVLLKIILSIVSH